MKEIKSEDIQIHRIEFWAEHEGNKGGIEIGWSCDMGYGTFQYYLDSNGRFHIGDDEFMGIDFAETVLHKALNIRR